MVPSIYTTKDQIIYHLVTDQKDIWYQVVPSMVPRKFMVPSVKWYGQRKMDENSRW